MTPEGASAILMEFDKILRGRKPHFMDSPKAKLIVLLVQEAVAQHRKVLVFVCMFPSCARHHTTFMNWIRGPSSSFPWLWDCKMSFVSSFRFQ